MKELKCPQCGSVFSVDEADYASIVSQVKTQEFEAELKARVLELQKQNEVKQEANTLKISQDFIGKLNAKDMELSKKETEITALKAQIEGFNQTKKLELNAERFKAKQEITRLQSVIEQNDSKGDFIFRDYSDGIEYISIMFEMKNEMDETATKHKNEDFFAKLDKDRNDKAQDLTIKKLTRGNPTMQQKFEEVRQQQQPTELTDQ